jgi:hypothetical protein
LINSVQFSGDNGGSGDSGDSGMTVVTMTTVVTARMMTKEKQNKPQWQKM